MMGRSKFFGIFAFDSVLFFPLAFIEPRFRFGTSRAQFVVNPSFFFSWFSPFYLGRLSFLELKSYLNFLACHLWQFCFR